MARDSLTALVALNRFGFGERGGGSGAFMNAASDPRGFVKAELNRPNGALLEVPGLQPTPALATAIFEYQFEQQQPRGAPAKGPPPPRPRGRGPPRPREANPRRKRRPMRNSRSGAICRSPISRKRSRRRTRRCRRL